MPHRTLTLALVLVSVLDFIVFMSQVMGFVVLQYAWLWVVLHVAFVLCGTLLLRQLLLNTIADHRSAYREVGEDISQLASNGSTYQPDFKLMSLIASMGLLIPGLGLPGIFLSMWYGLRTSLARSYAPPYWQLTPAASLPYVAPTGRTVSSLDSRGFSEHLLYSTDDEDIYRKVLALANVRTSLATDTLKQAMRHRDERVRLTAYKTLDKKVTALNKQIQSLEKSVANSDDKNSSDKWLQIASNYWELITLEGGEAVARKQLLSKAASAAINAVVQEPGNRNTHLVLGRVWLAQGDVRRAAVALDRSHALGMPGDKVIPYLAECAFVSRDMPRVQSLLSRLDPAIIEYPPLSHVARYWA